MAAVEVTAEFRPLDAAIVSEAIPAFFIGRNKQGFWVARDARGKIGGLAADRRAGTMAGAIHRFEDAGRHGDLPARLCRAGRMDARQFSYRSALSSTWKTAATPWSGILPRG